MHLHQLFRSLALLLLTVLLRPQIGWSADPQSLSRSIEGELLRIYKVQSTSIPSPKLLIVEDSHPGFGGDAGIRALYSKNTIYLSKSLTTSRHLTHALRHELSHWLVDHLSAGRCPAWLDEGLAQVFAGPPSKLVRQTGDQRIIALRALRLSTLEQGFTTLDEDTLLLAYTLSRRAAESMIWRWTLPQIREYLLKVSEGASNEQAFTAVFSSPFREFERSLYPATPPVTR